MMMRTLLLLLASTALGGLLRAANLAGSDDFNDNSKDSTKWGADTGIAGSPTGLLTETNGRLEFSASSVGGGDVRHPWILNQGSYVENWSVQLDTTINLGGPSPDAALALEVQKVGALNQFRMGILHERAQSAWDYYTFLLNSAGTQGSTTLPAVSAVSLRISFDAAAKVLTSYYDADGPANGYIWTQAASFGIAGSGGASGTDNWGMAAGDQFQIYVQGSTGTRVNAGLVYGDNFLAVPEPATLAMFASGASLLGCRRWRRSER